MIQKKDVDLYSSALHKLSFEGLTYEDTNEILVIILEQIEKNHFHEGLKYTLHFWGGMESGFDEYHGEIYPIIPTLFLDGIPFQNLYYIMDTLRNVVSVEEVAIELFQKGQGDALKSALKNLFDMLGQPSGVTYRLLWDEAMNSGNQVAIEFLSGLQSYYNNSIQKPSYVLDEEQFDEKDLLSIVDDILEEICPSNNMDDCIELLLKGLSQHGIDVVEMEEIKKILYQKLSNMNIHERTMYMKGFIGEQLEDNESLYHILGPMNQTNCNTPICKKYGGCRMFYCDCFEFHLLDPNQETKQENFSQCPRWFKGKCDKCCRDIPKRCYAVRRPLGDGGWLGTYCSWNCIHLSGKSDDEELIKKIEKEMNERKIMERDERIE
jgi:hypothetical protein